MMQKDCSRRPEGQQKRELELLYLSLLRSLVLLRLLQKYLLVIRFFNFLSFTFLQLCLSEDFYALYVVRAFPTGSPLHLFDPGM